MALISLFRSSTIGRVPESLDLAAVAAISGYLDHAVGALRQAKCFQMPLNHTIQGDFVRELGAVSNRMGRAVATGEARTRLRSIAPFFCSALRGSPQGGLATTGY